MTIDMSQFYQVFFDEADELLAEMEKLLLALDVSAPDSEDLNAIFRAAHGRPKCRAAQPSPASTSTATSTCFQLVSIRCSHVAARCGAQVAMTASSSALSATSQRPPSANRMKRGLRASRDSIVTSLRG